MKIHFEEKSPVWFQNCIIDTFTRLYKRNSEVIVLCIGTDRMTGDSLGPLTGTKLVELGVDPKMVYGTLDEPVHAQNLQDTINTINQKHDNPFIIAVDACLGRSESVGFIKVKEGPLQPGSGAGKDLPAVGDLQVIGIVAVGGFMEHTVLQNVRLNLVVKMAKIISYGLYSTIQTLSVCKNVAAAGEMPA